MNSPPALPPAMPDSDICRRLDEAQLALERSLGAWGAASMVTGAILVAAGRHQGRPGWVAAGRQHLAWGGVDAALAGLGRFRRRRTGLLDLAAAGRSAATLRRLLLVNAGLDLVYVGAGLTMLLAPRRLLRSWPDKADVVRPAGGAVLVQGCFLLILDAAVAARLGPVDPPAKES